MKNFKIYFTKTSCSPSNLVIKILEQAGGVNTHAYKGTCCDTIYYFTNKDKNIHLVKQKDLLYKIIIHIGIELQVPCEWESLPHTKGFITLAGGGTKEIIDNQKYKSSFATEQQAESSVVAAMISQIRAQNTRVYGEFVPKHKGAFIIMEYGINYVVSSAKTRYFGGLLRFETKEQAELFLNNHQDLIKIYFKTF